MELVTAFLTIIIWVVMFLIAGRVVTWAWNNSVAPVFEMKALTETQGLALFTLTFMLLGFWRL